MEAEGVMKDVQMEMTETLLRAVGGGRKAMSCGCRNPRKDKAAAGATTMVSAEISRRGTASVVIRASSHMNGALAKIKIMVPPVPGGTMTTVAVEAVRCALETGHAQAAVSMFSQEKMPAGSAVLQKTKAASPWMASGWATRAASIGEDAAGTLAGHLGPAVGAKPCVPCCLLAQMVRYRQLIQKCGSWRQRCGKTWSRGRCRRTWNSRDTA